MLGPANKSYSTEIPENILKGKGKGEEIIKILDAGTFREILKYHCGSIFHITTPNGNFIKGEKEIIKQIKIQLAPTNYDYIIEDWVTEDKAKERYPDGFANKAFDSGEN